MKNKKILTKKDITLLKEERANKIVSSFKDTFKKIKRIDESFEEDLTEDDNYRDPEYGLYNSRDNEGENDDPWADEDAQIKADQEGFMETKASEIFSGVQNLAEMCYEFQKDISNGTTENIPTNVEFLRMLGDHLFNTSESTKRLVKLLEMENKEQTPRH